MKTMSSIRDAEAEKYAENQFNYWKQMTIKTSNPTLQPSSDADSFKAGWDARDKLGDEALGKAVEALEFYASKHNWRKLPNEPSGMKYFYKIGSKDGSDIGPEQYTFCGGKTARSSLAEIRKIMGDE